VTVHGVHLFHRVVAESWPRAASSLVHGYARCDDAGYDRGWVKIAVYVKAGNAEHFARQLPNGRWVSKLGPLVDIEHSAAADVACGGFGLPGVFYERSAAHHTPRELHPKTNAFVDGTGRVLARLPRGVGS
jgi:hypothetical protein